MQSVQPSAVLSGAVFRNACNHAVFASGHHRCVDDGPRSVLFLPHPVSLDCLSLHCSSDRDLWRFTSVRRRRCIWCQSRLRSGSGNVSCWLFSARHKQKHCEYDHSDRNNSDDDVPVHGLLLCFGCFEPVIDTKVPPVPACSLESDMAAQPIRILSEDGDNHVILTRVRCASSAGPRC